MKKISLILCLCCIQLSLWAQKQDSIVNKKTITIKIPNNGNDDNKKSKDDTNIVNIGPIEIVIKPKNIELNFDSTKAKNNNIKNKKPKSIKTSYLGFDIGLCNINSLTSNIPSGISVNNKLNLREEKSIDINLFLIQQRINLYQHKINLRWGLGVNWKNFRFSDNLNLNTDHVSNTLTTSYDSTNFTKNKWVNRYITLPVMIELNLGKSSSWKHFKLAAGASFNQYFGSWQKQISAEKGKTTLHHGNYNLAQQRVDAVVRLGLGKLNFYGSYALTPMLSSSQQKTNYMPVMYPYSFGIQLNGL